MSSLTLTGISRAFGAFEAVRPTTLEIASGEFFAVLGPSGCGKTTLLRLIAGYEPPDAGTIALDGVDITKASPRERGIGMVFQNYALFPHMNVFDNVAFGLRARRVSGSSVAARVAAALRSVKMEGKSSSPVTALSGGEQQRVAVARALVLLPRLLLFDEPLSNLDAALRVETRDEIRELQRSTGITTVYVTHDQGEAMALADRMAVMQGGSVEQSGTPAELYDAPATPFVASFLGGASLIEGDLSADRTFRAAGGIALRVPAAVRAPAPGPVTLAAKPEGVAVLRGDGGEIAATVIAAEYTGFTTAYRLGAGETPLKALEVSGAPGAGAQPGARVSLRLDWTHCALYAR
ncbi:MAG TPA: ABC transporter ATP-binding protein [Bacteroidota bacterium]|nr:ABC transporter ATP-binding protein [Bacteroidota bacterium]